jgi:endonuclease/exonuclease/phosphatase family metal-dependent hydrolase
MFFLRSVIVVLLVFSLSFVSISRSQQGDAQSGTTRVAQEQESSLLEVGGNTKHHKPSTVNDIKIVSYNIRYRSGEELRKLVNLLREDPEIGKATVIGLQEVDRRKKRSGNAHTAKIIAESLDLRYAWAAPPVAKEDQEEETGVAIMSMYPLSDVRRIVLPNEGPNKRRRVALGATVTIGGTAVRVYSIHSETRISVDKRLEQMQAILQDLKQFPDRMPAIVVGDFNTWQPSAGPKTIKLFSSAGLQTPFGSQPTFSTKALFLPIEMRLDWAWFRGVQVLTYGIDRKISLSDHWPLWINVKLPVEREPPIQHR